MTPHKNSVIYAIFKARAGVISVVIFTMFGPLYVLAFVRCLEYLTEYFKYRQILKNSVSNV